MEISERVKRCIDRHPDWTTKRISNSTCATFALIDSIRSGAPVVLNPSNLTGLKPVTPERAAAPACVLLSTVRDRLDVAAMIRRQVGQIPKGQLLPEDDLCRLTAGRDRNRFRRAIENNPDEFKMHRVRLRLDESTDGKWFWGRAADVAEAIRIRDL